MAQSASQLLQGTQWSTSGGLGGSPPAIGKVRKQTPTQRLLADQPLCEVCRSPARERCHLVSRMELRRLRSQGRRVNAYFHKAENLAALCRMCHDALDCHLGVTKWYVQQVSGIRAYDVLMKHYDRNLYGFRRLQHKRNLVLIALSDIANG